MAVLYKFGTGRYLDPDRTVYVVEDGDGCVFRIFRAGLEVVNGTVRRHLSGNLAIARGRLGAPVAGDCIMLREGRTCDWAISEVADVLELTRRAEGTPYDPPPPGVPDLSGLSQDAQRVASDALKQYLLMRAPRRNLLFGSFTDTGIHWNIFKHIPHPSERLRGVATGAEAPAVITQLLKAAQLRAKGAGLYPRPRNSLVVRQGHDWYRTTDRDPPQRLVGVDEAAVVDLVVFTPSLVPMGWPLRSLTKVIGVLRTGGEAFFPVKGHSPTSLLVPVPQQQHIVVAVETLRSRGVVGLTLFRGYDGRVHSRSYSGPWQPNYIMCPDHTVVALPK